MNSWVSQFVEWDREERLNALQQLSQQVPDLSALLAEADPRVLERKASLPYLVHVDLIARLPSVVCVRVFEFFGGESLSQCAMVNRFWRQSVYSESADAVWGREFASTWPSSTLSLNLESSKLLWRELWHKNLRCRRLWKSAKVIKTEFLGHTDRVRHVRVRGGRFVSASWDGTLRYGECVSSTSGAEGSSEQLAKHAGSIFGVWFDGKVAATCSDDHTIKLWHVEWKKCITELRGHQGPVYRLELVNSETLVSCSYDFIGVWHWPSATLLHKLTGHKHDVHRLKVCADYIVSGSYDETIRVWSYPDCALLWNSPPVHRGGVSCLFLSGDLVASGSAKGEVFLWNLNHGKMLFRETESHQGALVTSIWADAKRDMCISSSIISFQHSGGILCIWSVSTKSCLQKIEEKAFINAFRIEFGLLFGAYSDGVMRIRDLFNNYKVVREEEQSKGQLFDVDIQGEYAVTCGLDKVILSRLPIV